MVPQVQRSLKAATTKKNIPRSEAQINNIVETARAINMEESNPLGR
jgi:hypothetical protein